MSMAWPRGKLKEVMGLSDTAVPSAQLGEINLAGVYSFGRGLFARGPMLPEKTSYKSYNRLVTNDFVISQPKAWEGAIARVHPEFDGWYLSPVFPTFRADRSKIEPIFLEWFCKRKAVWNELQRHSRGIGARRETVSPETFLDLEIPLPPLSDQQRIVAKIEQFHGQIKDTRILQHENDLNLNRMLLSAFWKIAKDAPRRPLGQIAPLIRRTVKIDPEVFYPELGIRSFGNGTFHKSAISGHELGGKKIYKIEPGDLLFSNVFAWEGAIAVATPQDANRFGSHRYITCVPVKDIATSRFLCFYFLTDEGLELIRAGSPGGAGRNRTLGLQALAKITVPVPQIGKQLWFNSLQSAVDEIKLIQTRTTTELDALLPAILDRAFRGEL